MATDREYVHSEEMLKRDAAEFLSNMPTNWKLKNPLMFYYGDPTLSQSPSWVTDPPILIMAGTRNRNGSHPIAAFLKNLASLKAWKNLMVVIYYDPKLPPLMDIEESLVTMIPISHTRR